jgi:uracil-DNA glycosylase family 4
MSAHRAPPHGAWSSDDRRNVGGTDCASSGRDAQRIPQRDELLMTQGSPPSSTSGPRGPAEVRSEKLRVLHDEIGACRVCEPLTASYSKPASMARGDAGDVVIVGESPGAKELASGRAFSGNAGTRLDQWLLAGGSPRNNPREGVYLTSVVKCRSIEKSDLVTMSRRCIAFLRRQIDVIAPKVVITLGQFAYSMLSTQLQWKDAVCGLFESRECWLVSPFAVPFKLLVWPHPSGLSRWTNEPSNRVRLEESFAVLRAARSSAGGMR